MDLEIITAAERLYQGEVNLVRVPGTKGPFTILRNHAPIISALEKGTVKIVDKHNETSYIEVLGGIVEVNKNKIIVLADIE
ncbi:MAG: ATP synthase F1 subunit epsilon [Bacteroidales bacterium]|nr:MAG: ATP synthase F1 subunit epsilon [Bacteroidales bacterium]